MLLLLLHSLHLICIDGSKTDNQKFLPFFHHLVFHLSLMWEGVSYILHSLILLTHF